MSKIFKNEWCKILIILKTSKIIIKKCSKNFKYKFLTAYLPSKTFAKWNIEQKLFQKGYQI